MNRALIDTGAIYALVTGVDRHHHDAVHFLENWIQRKGIFLLSDLVFIETLTLAKRRLGSKTAIRIGRELRENRLFTWIPLTPQIEQETWLSFQSYEDKEWSYTDCELLVLSNRLKTINIFTFDDHFRQMQGIRCLP
jgi:predicted nucleic acid-binding protein